MVQDRAPREALSRRFRLFADECRAASPLYERLSLGIAGDDEMLALAAESQSEPVPNLFFAAVHAPLLGGAEHPVAAFYPSVSDNVPDGDPYPLFRSFCLERAPEIRALLRTRRVQTNEVRRCAVLLPAFGLVASRANIPLALVEVGASAGLNLLFDRYGYDYGEGGGLGEPRSPVQISCELRGGRVPPLPGRFPEISSRVGIDLDPIDARDPEAVLWLEALIWPEEYEERAALLRRAVRLARERTPPLVAGDALEVLPGILAGIPEDAVPCVFHTFTVNQFPEEARERLSGVISEHAAGRDLFGVSIEILPGAEHASLELVSFPGGAERRELLARCNGHATWMEWLGSGPEG